MLIVHHLEDSRSLRVRWLLEELVLPYPVRRNECDPTTVHAPPELSRVHVLGKAPVITAGPATVAEMGAIVEYLPAPGQRPPAPRRRFSSSPGSSASCPR